MKRFRTAALPTLVLGSVVLAACGAFGASTATPSPTFTPDPCAPTSLPNETAKVAALMREFDDASFVAQYTPSAQLGSAISELQRIRRAAEDQVVPACLSDLKDLQLQHMNAVIVTLAILMDPSTPPELISQGIGAARQLHDQYEIELARLLGVTFVAPSTMTPGPGPTVAASAPPNATSTVTTALVINPGPTTLNLRVKPALDAATMGTLNVGQSAILLGKTPDDLWFMIGIPDQPGQTAWVYAQLVQASMDIASIPVSAATP